jgi:hypothetical protein
VSLFAGCFESISQSLIRRLMASGSLFGMGFSAPAYRLETIGRVRGLSLAQVGLGALAAPHGAQQVAKTTAQVAHRQRAVNAQQFVAADLFMCY